MRLPATTGDVDPYAAFEPLDTCDPKERPGVVEFRRFVLQDVEGLEPGSDEWRAADWGIVRSCEPGRQTSKHQQGRAWDWHPTTPQLADTLIAALLAKDEEGNAHAYARRAGIRTIIWNGRIWHSGRRKWTDYRSSNPHTDHVHFGFSWDGAEGRTSFYTRPREGILSPLNRGGGAGRTGRRGEQRPDEMKCNNATKVPTVRTPRTYLEIARDLARAHVALWGVAPSANRLGVAWSQVMLETGRGQSIWGNNFGNIICTQAWKGDYQELQDGPADPHFYRAYSTPSEGAQDYWRLLSSRYGAALELFDQGRPADAARALSAAGYFTAPPEPIAKTFAKLYAEYNEKIGRPSWISGVAPLVVLGAVAHRSARA